MMRDLQSQFFFLQEFLLQGNISLTVLLEVWIFFLVDWILGFFGFLFMSDLILPYYYCIFYYNILDCSWSIFLFVTAFYIFED